MHDRLRHVPIGPELLIALDRPGKQRQKVQLIVEVAPQRWLDDLLLDHIDQEMDLPKEQVTQSDDADRVCEPIRWQKLVLLEDDKCRDEPGQVHRESSSRPPPLEQSRRCITAQQKSAESENAGEIRQEECQKRAIANGERNPPAAGPREMKKDCR